MTFGAKRFKQLLLPIVTGGVIGIASLLLSDIVNGIQSPEGVKSESSNELTLEQLTNSLARNPLSHVHFEEIYVSHFLTTPIKKLGTLSYTPPSRFEKHIVSPTEESLVIDEDTVRYHNITQGVQHSLSLQDVPVLHAFIIGLRSIFSGDLQTLQRNYELKLNGPPHQWVLTLFPLDKEVQESVTFLRLKGIQIHVTEIEIQESNGDRSIIFLKEM